MKLFKHTYQIFFSLINFEILIKIHYKKNGKILYQYNLYAGDNKYFLVKKIYHCNHVIIICNLFLSEFIKS